MKAIRVMVAGALMAWAATAGAGYVNDAGKSEAMNFALAVGLTDAQKGPLLDGEVGRMRDNSTGAFIDKSFDGATGAANIVMGGSSALSATGLVSFLLGPSGGKHPAAGMHIYGFVPAASAPDADAAAALLDKTLSDAVVRALGYAATTETVTIKAVFNSSQREMVLVTGGDVCGRVVACRVKTAIFGKQERSNDVGAIAPWCGSGCYVWTKAQWGDHYSERSDNIFFQVFDINDHSKQLYADDLKKLGIAAPTIDRATIARASAYMPGWVSIYLPPTGKEPPVVLRAGVQQMFVKPGAGAMATQSAVPVASPVVATAGRLVARATSLYARPMPDGQIVGSAAAGERVTVSTSVSNQSGSWMYVEGPSGRGWVSAVALQ